jgi:hypothetical protein
MLLNAVFDVLLALLLVDVLTALLHWTEDTYLWYGMEVPLLREIAAANEMHHWMPRTITYYGYLEQSRVNVAVTLGVLLLAWLCGVSPREHPCFYAVALVAGCMSNVLHRWQHERDCERPRVVTALQRAGVLVGREAHREHHAAAKPSHSYGTVLAPLNRLYDAAGLWAALERCAAAAGARACHVRGCASDYEERDRFDEECPRQLTAEDMRRYQAQLRDFFLKGAALCAK